MMKPILYGIVFLFGLVTVVGLGITTFLLGERLLGQKVEPPAITPDANLAEPGMKEFKLVIRETEENVNHSPELSDEPTPSTFNSKFILVNEPSDPLTSYPVSVPGCPLDDSCVSLAGTAVKQIY